MNLLHAAISARGSSDQQAAAHTMASQVAALQERVTLDGRVLRDTMQCLDEGDSGAP